MVRARALRVLGAVVLSAALAFVVAPSASASNPNAGTLDSAFMSNYQASGVYMFYSAAAEQPDGKIVLGGEFSGGLARLNADGTADSAFNTALGTGFTDTQSSATVTAVAVQADGGLIVGGVFNRFNGVPVGPVVRLTSAGALDTTFSANAATVVGARVSGQGFPSLQAIAVSAGRIYVGGSFTGGTAGSSYLIHLNSNGTQAASSYNLLDGAVATIEPLADGSTLLGGSFTGWGLSPKVMRIDASDNIDTGFTSMSLGVPNGDVYSIAQAPNGDIFYGGDFTAIGSTPSVRVAKSSSTGALDTSFSLGIGSGPDATVLSVAPQADGRVAVVGQFQNFDGVAANFISERTTTGLADTTFRANAGAGLDNYHSHAITLSTGNVLVFGRFGCYAGSYPNCTGGTVVNALANINATPTYTLRYHANGGAGATPSNQTFLTSATVATGTGLNRPGYTFQRWNTAQGGGGTNINAAATYNTAADADLWAVWSANPYSVTYSTGSGGSAVTAGTYSTGGSFTAAAMPTRAGYTFTNWTITDSDSSTHTVNAGASYTPVGYGNITAAANWTVNPYTVSYQANGASGSVAATAFNVTAPATIAAGTGLTNPGYSFAGWNTSQGGGGTPYLAGASYSTLANLVLNAQWAPTTQTVTYDANGGTGAVANGSYTTGGQALSVADGSGLARSTYSFAGWNTAANGSGTGYSAGANFTGVSSVTLYAQWVSLAPSPAPAAAATSGSLASTGFTPAALLLALPLIALGIAVRRRTN